MPGKRTAADSGIGFHNREIPFSFENWKKGILDNIVIEALFKVWKKDKFKNFSGGVWFDKEKLQKAFKQVQREYPRLEFNLDTKHCLLVHLGYEQIVNYILWRSGDKQKIEQCQCEIQDRMVNMILREYQENYQTIVNTHAKLVKKDYHAGLIKDIRKLLFGEELNSTQEERKFTTAIIDKTTYFQNYSFIDDDLKDTRDACALIQRGYPFTRNIYCMVDDYPDFLDWLRGIAGDKESEKDFIHEALSIHKLPYIQAEALYRHLKWLENLPPHDTDKLAISPNGISVIPTKYIRAFKWKEINPEMEKKQIVSLWEQFTGENIVRTELNIFQKAFSGEILQQPLHIPYAVSGKNKKISKTSLFNTYELLVKYLVEPVPREKLYETLEWLFADDHGQPLQYLRQSSSAYHNHKKSAKADLIEYIIRQVSKIK